jgi:hypothetical protein
MVTIQSQGIWSGGELQGLADSREVVSTGFAAVDALLPAGGVRRGSLVEWIAGGADTAGDVACGTGTVSLALAIGCRLAKPASHGATKPQTILVVDRSGWFHPPAVMPWRGDARLIVARPSHDDDEIWTIDQALRCRGVAAVVAWPRGMAGHVAANAGARSRARDGSRRFSPWTTAMRRWQLAARSSGGIGLFVRSATAVREPSWAEARFAVTPLKGSPSLTAAPSLVRSSSLYAASFLQRRLRIERVGGAWNGGLTGQATETVLDLARGCEGSLLHPMPQSLPLPLPRDRDHVARLARTNQGGATCRAS